MTGDALVLIAELLQVARLEAGGGTSDPGDQRGRSNFELMFT
ncbi:hypothetical protein [Saccharopolyspora aridisoli]|nr:hypothetical protein [Saccharopolyspora aridisoli]